MNSRSSRLDSLREPAQNFKPVPLGPALSSYRGTLLKQIQKQKWRDGPPAAKAFQADEEEIRMSPEVHTSTAILGVEGGRGGQRQPASVGVQCGESQRANSRELTSSDGQMRDRILETVRALYEEVCRLEDREKKNKKRGRGRGKVIHSFTTPSEDERGGEGEKTFGPKTSDATLRGELQRAATELHEGRFCADAVAEQVMSRLLVEEAGKRTFVRPVSDYAAASGRARSGVIPPESAWLDAIAARARESPGEGMLLGCMATQLSGEVPGRFRASTVMNAPLRGRAST
uniref:Uncharacterized protein n=1 Tax=Chromera velia CCMP2878 TaxID=1169474 RepID=A0A0K6S8E3_9ALVE|eukprot:Cvel_839.t1-p1 / transcript=Cvel_839.t1 / gene=Cvel_839 / organism=Chromera_velia_CCMP2878 / gene_product=hypothetical protein / transcript_product=hypothetical protein / location=Cvel_scaffold26:61395-65577(-) / protein_length=287 / sequence_SO=supercontig / SO=protein_coding / is_pseudo=false